MTLLVVEGWELYGTTSFGFWSSAPASIQTGGPSGRFGRSTGGDATRILPSTETSFVFGARMRHNTSAFTSGVNNVRFDEGTTNHLGIRHTDDGSIRLFRGTTQIAQSATGVWNFDTWAYIEVKATIADSGSCIVKVGGTEVINFSGDTQNGGTGALDRFTFDAAGSSVTLDFDDVYFCDQGGSLNNDFLGACIVEALLPNGNGNYSQQTGSDGNQTDNYLLVDEAPSPDSDTTYVVGDTIGEKDTYAFSNVVNSSATIKGVRAIAICRHEGAGGTSRHVHRRSTTDSFSSAFTPGASYTGHETIWEQDPAAGPGAWTVSNLDASEFGVDIVS